MFRNFNGFETLSGTGIRVGVEKKSMQIHSGQNVLWLNKIDCTNSDFKVISSRLGYRLQSAIFDEMIDRFIEK